MQLPAAVEELCDELARARGIERIVLGGSRAIGTAPHRSHATEPTSSVVRLSLGWSRTPGIGVDSFEP